MIKGHLTIILLVLLFLFASASNILTIMSYKATHYVALALMAIVLTVAYVVIRKHTNKGAKNEDDDK